MSLSYRRSYLKTAIAALAVGLMSLALSLRWFALGRLGWPLPPSGAGDSRTVAWTLATLLLAPGVAGLLVAAGGFFALHGDAQERVSEPS